MKSPFLLAVVLTFLWPSASLHGQIAQRPAVRASGPVADTLRDLAVHMMSMLRDRDTEGLIGLYGDTLHFVHVEDGNVVP